MKKATRYYSKKQETRVAKELNGNKTANSGATAFDKGDVKTKYLLIECKTATKKVESMTLEREWFEKIKEEAFARRRTFGIVIFDFGDGIDYVAMRNRDFHKLGEVWEDNHDGIFIVMESLLRDKPQKSIIIHKEVLIHVEEESIARPDSFGILNFTFGDNITYTIMKRNDFKLFYEEWEREMEENG